MTGDIVIVDMADYCPQCRAPWREHPKLDANGMTPDGIRMGDPGEEYCRQPTDAPAPAYILRLRRGPQRALFPAAMLALAFALVMLALAPPAMAAAAPTGTWDIRTFSGANQTRAFTYPGTVNVTLRPLNITVSGQRTVTIGDAVNASLVYLSTSVGFFPAGSNFTKSSTVNLSWSIPQGLQDGATLVLGVGLSGVKAPETSILLEVKANISHVVHGIVDPILSYFQTRLAQLQQDNANLQGALADTDFHHSQIEGVLGFVIAGLIADRIYQRRKKANRSEDIQKSDTGYLEHMAEAVADTSFTVEAARAPPEPEKPKGA